MRTARAALVAILLASSCAAFARPGGMGGIGLGMQYYDPGFASADLGMACITGYGYGTSWEGQRFGGFGMALLSFEGLAEGGVGGMMIGQELRSGPMVAAATVMLGVGGLAWQGGGYMLVFGEADLEVGIRVLPWMQIVGYIGYQAWGNFIPGRPLADAALLTPVCGIRLGWGSR